jgi:hypothetical protein
MPGIPEFTDPKKRSAAEMLLHARLAPDSVQHPADLETVWPLDCLR